MNYPQSKLTEWQRKLDILKECPLLLHYTILRLELRSMILVTFYWSMYTNSSTLTGNLMTFSFKFAISFIDKCDRRQPLSPNV